MQLVGSSSFDENKGLLNEFKHVHLLGSHHPYEKCFYKDDIIQTMDTGYPVKCGYEGYYLFEEPKKPTCIIDDFLGDLMPENKKETIAWNIERFKSL